MANLIQELKNAARSVAKRPAFSALIVGVLAAGLACVIFMLAMLNGFVLRPLPFAQPDQLLHVGVREDGGNDLNPVQNHDLIEVRRQLADVAETAGFARSTMNLSDLDRPERSSGAFVSANLARVLGVAPLLGRDFPTRTRAMARRRSRCFRTRCGKAAMAAIRPSSAARYASTPNRRRWSA